MSSDVIKSLIDKLRESFHETVAIMVMSRPELFMFTRREDKDGPRMRPPVDSG